MPVDRKTACLEQIRMSILTMDIPPGGELDEAALCGRHGISRTPMREIFQRLAGEGYLRLEQNRAPKAASMDMPAMRMFFRTAPTVYAHMARLAAENRRGDEIPPLRAVQDGFRAAAEGDDAGRAALLNHRFHLSLGEMARNPYLLPSLKRMLIDHTRLSQTFYRPDSEDGKARVLKAIEHHDAMIVAVEARESALAVELTLEHWDLSRDMLERFVSPDPLPIDVLDMRGLGHAV